MDPLTFAEFVLDLCPRPLSPDLALELPAAADEYAAWAIERYARHRAAVDEPTGKLGALAEGRKLLAHRELTGTGGER